MVWMDTFESAISCFPCSICSSICCHFVFLNCKVRVLNPIGVAFSFELNQLTKTNFPNTLFITFLSKRKIIISYWMIITEIEATLNAAKYRVMQWVTLASGVYNKSNDIPGWRFTNSLHWTIRIIFAASQKFLQNLLVSITANHALFL